MPQAGDYITCVSVKNKILISCLQFRLISYDIENDAYSQVGFEGYSLKHRCTASSEQNYICSKVLRFLRWPNNVKY